VIRTVLAPALPFAHLAITDQASGATDLEGLAALGGALLLRDKHEKPSTREALAQTLRAATTKLDIPLIVHGDAALARQVAADGLHLPSHTPPRAIPGLIVGCSCHDETELDRAVAAGVDYVMLSPVLSSPGKSRPLGWDRFAALAQRCPLPLFALGGLGPEDLAQARSHGAWGIAGIRGFLSSIRSRDPGA
jgi:8-oxo-dGTP diphosphatase